MRISVERGDAGYMPFAMLGEGRSDARIFLDGVEQRECITADDEAGEIKRFIRNADGTFAYRGDEALTEVVTGKVEIVLP